MKLRLGRYWPVLKGLLALVILGCVGWQFARDLRGLNFGELALRPAWVAVSAALYLLFLGSSAWYWLRLLRTFGQSPAVLPATRAYYVGQLGKYVPGKAMALLVRGTLIAGPDVRLGVAIITAFYEVLTTMAAGALLAALLFTLSPPAAVNLEWHPGLLGALLLVLVGVPLLPPVFNRLVQRLAGRFQKIESFRLPRLRGATLLQGLIAIGGGWALLGLSFWSALQAVLPETQPLTGRLWARYTAIIALAYVGGFLAVVSPGGLGVREWVLGEILPAELEDQDVSSRKAVADVAVLLLRLVWTAAELLIAAGLYWLPGTRSSSGC